jgi:hypothetical protein
VDVRKWFVLFIKDERKGTQTVMVSREHTEPMDFSVSCHGMTIFPDVFGTQEEAESQAEELRTVHGAELLNLNDLKKKQEG